jgi:hypothetical protein
VSELIDRVRRFRNSPTIRGTFPPGWLRSIGFDYATLVGLTIGLPLSKGRVRKEGDLIIFTGLPQWAFKRGGTTIGQVYLTRDNDGDDVIEHEKVHVEQWRKYGFWFPLLYALAGPNPHTNRFEIEAGLEKGGYVKAARRAPARRPGTQSATQSAPSTAAESNDGSEVGDGAGV